MTRERWGRLAETYDEDHTYISGEDLVRQVQEWLRGEVPPGEVIELGCGTGLYTRAYAPLAHRVIAVDASEGMLVSAREALATHENVTLRHADAAATGLPEASADAVVAVNLLHVAQDPDGIVREARRLVRPGGAVLIVDFTTEGVAARKVLAGIVRVLRRWGPMTQPKAARHLDLDRIQQLASDASLVSVEGRFMRGERMDADAVRGRAPVSV